MTEPTPASTPADPTGKHSAPEPVESDGATPKDDDQLGEGGKKALAAERDRAKNLEKELAKYRKADQDRADADKTEAEKRAAAEARADAAELKSLKFEVGAEKGLNAKQAARLVGSTRDELEADADELLANFPAAAPTKATPKPDPSQGPKNPAQPRARSLTEAISAEFAKSRASGN